jgi:hypothetical protein
MFASSGFAALIRIVFIYVGSALVIRRPLIRAQLIAGLTFKQLTEGQHVLLCFSTLAQE